MATAEALAAGLPVIGFADCPGTNELIVHDFNGWLVKPGPAGSRVISMAAGLSELMTDDNLRMRLGRNGLSSIGDFDPEVVVDMWESLLAGTAGQQP